MTRPAPIIEGAPMTPDAEACGAKCPEESSWICRREQGHPGRHESPDGGDWYDTEDACRPVEVYTADGITVAQVCPEVGQ